MAGTGKSQVIKALMAFFAQRQESYRFMCIAPTGSAASLIQGSTYHSMLQIGQYSVDNPKNISNVQNRLKRVEYMFLDEVSMVDCKSLYSICAKMCKAFRDEDKPFGGINMICAGDFAQLPPPMHKYPLYSGNIDSVIHTTNSYIIQENIIGKAIWHQFTTVIILRQNMRQKTQTTEDGKFRKALENMRFKACTQEDISFIRSLVVKPDTDRSLSNPDFRNVSIITALNAYRDKINIIGCDRFAQEHDEEIHTFYSVDKWTSRKSSKKTRQQPVDPLRVSDNLPPILQERLWELPPANTEHRPGKLMLCLGLPILIKYNEATECGVTNGAEAIVVGWKSKPISENRKGLEVVFAMLTSPPNPIKLDGLPENVVPIMAQTQAITCQMRYDKEYRISRGQVPILPNFAMTDFSSQGRTRLYNVVDLQNCNTHQSIYTCLSRSASAKNTLIIQGFDSQRITGGLSGYLRQEFRELELLDQITELKYLGTLPDNICAETRRALIYQFRKWKGTNFVPTNTHNAIKWNEDDPLILQEPEINPKFTLIGKKVKITGNVEVTETQLAHKHIQINQVSSYIPAKGTKALNAMSSEPGRKKGARRSQAVKKTDRFIDAMIAKAKQVSNDSNTIQGFAWNDTLTCAYDSLWSILWSVYKSDVENWDNNVRLENKLFEKFTELMESVENKDKSKEEARDNLRYHFHQRHPEYFPIEATDNGTSIDNLCTEMFMQSEPIMTYNTLCTVCDTLYDTEEGSSILWDCNEVIWKNSPLRKGTYKYSSLQSWIPVLTSQKTHMQCPTCNIGLQRNITYDIFPTFIPFNIYSATINIEPELIIQEQHYRLCGIIYHGKFHFTARVITTDDKVWYYDGMEKKGDCQYQGTLKELSSANLRKIKGRQATIAIYVKL